MAVSPTGANGSSSATTAAAAAAKANGGKLPKIRDTWVYATGGPIVRSWGSAVGGLVIAPFSFVNRLFWRFAGALSRMIWKDRTPSVMVDVWKRSYFLISYQTKIPAEEAIDGQYLNIENKPYTPDYCKKHITGCDEEYLKSRGYVNVEFDYISWGRQYHYKGSLRPALIAKTISGADAVVQNLLTEKQTLSGGWTTKAKIADARKAAAKAATEAAAATAATKKKSQTK
ncbi:MAG TPA: hypothetical protein VMR37_00285 [Rhabdochlamydiaceae bacterium]|jgi:hypothetical protein|nr:hypothetical protein [Rhabdochlamydiaceae bacterium]